MFMKFGNLVHRIKYIGVKLQNNCVIIDGMHVSD